MKIVTWNVNSIRQRIHHLCDLLRKTSYNIVLLQETKCLEEQFPKEPLEDLGYNLVIFGQKSFNGVAILSKKPIEDVQYGIDGAFDGGQARYIEAVTGHVRVASIYVPNGQEVGGEQYAYKLAFFEALRLHVKQRLEYQEAFILGGDFNVAPSDFDVYDPKLWHEKILCSTSERLAFQSLLNLGYVDSLRILYPSGPKYTWWDYRTRGFENHHGLRIDHLLLSPKAADLLLGGDVEFSIRGLDKTSDHAPVWCEIKD